MGVGKEIAQARKSMGLTQKALAENINITPSYLSEIEAEKKMASFDTIVRIADALDCSLDILAGKELSEAALFSEADKAARYCKEDGLIRKSVLMMGPLDEDSRHKVFTYIQDQKDLSRIKSDQDAAR